MVDDYIIDKVGWHTQTEGNPENPEDIDLRFRSLLTFLVEKDLLAREVVVSEGPLPDAFEIRASDLTPEGLAVMKSAYDRSLNALDRGTDPRKVTILSRAVENIRGGDDT